MAVTIRVDCEAITRLSEHLREAWNDYFWTYRSCRRKIRFTDEEKTNYFSDLINYFDDITRLLSTFRIQDNYRAALYDATAVLQLMYIQQDLVDEMLTIFKLPQSSSDEKTLIRELRNELIGHPISRDKSENLISSVFITAETKGERLEYVRYHRDKNFSFDIRSFNWRDIFQWHDKYLKDCLLKIGGAIKEKLIRFQRNLIKMSEQLPNTPFEKLINWVDQVFETVPKSYPYLYSKESILTFYRKMDLHPRYRFVVDKYLSDLKHWLAEVIADIDEFVSNAFNNSVSQSAKTNFENIWNFENPDEYSINDALPTQSIRYEFGKLFEKHEVFGVNYFINVYNDDKELMDELENMKLNIENNSEYYASIEYLRMLFQRRGVL